MERRLKKGGGRPELDVFGSRYENAAFFLHIGNGYHVAVASSAGRDQVQKAIEDIRVWLNFQIEIEEQDIESGTEDDSETV